jgi:hypothetical protein
MLRNTAGQTWTVFAFNEDGPVDGDAANITAVIRRDGVEAPLDDLHPTPLAGQAGFYDFTLTAGETDFHEARLFPVSSTDGVEVYGVPQLQVISDVEVSFQVLPLTGGAESRVQGTNITAFTGEALTVSIPVTNAAGDPVDVEGMSLEVIFENVNGGDLAVIDNAEIAKSGSTVTFTLPNEVVATLADKAWAMRSLSGHVVQLHGIVQVKHAPKRD